MIVLHVGPQRTGTTFLQREVFPRIPDAWLYGNNNTPFDFKSPLAANRLNIISDEGFYGNPWDKGIPYASKYTIGKRLRQVFPDAKILVGMREHDEWLNSVYNTYIRRGGYVDRESNRSRGRIAGVGQKTSVVS